MLPFKLQQLGLAASAEFEEDDWELFAIGLCFQLVRLVELQIFKVEGVLGYHC